MSTRIHPLATAMRSLLVIIACLIIMLLGLFGTAAILFDEGRVKSLVARHIENQTGHRVEIQGALKLRFFPNVNLSAERVVLSRPDDAEGPAFFTSDRLDMQLRLLPLIRGRVDATEVRLGGARINYASNQPEIDLEAESNRDRLEAPVIHVGVVVATAD
ncbi:MAG: AsmA family protein, partial [Wenzhouxiangella sp.]